ncbi:hypothetical protein [Lacihabitans soyangensis]|uniref:Lipoprotein n=1 Tax=Lacihabitans soyangensis TaxID=869394 RepID=A0AAE3H6P6_9BACT|nr:hypothetical protein [Lacihabitans soyangensis]MCP9765041.1 hypothetical protein [Lacihabitans soyangensis]
MKNYILIAIFLIFSCKKEQSILISECNIKNPEKELPWVFNEHYLKWEQHKGYYHHVYYGFLKKSDSQRLSRLGFFKERSPREIVIVVINGNKENYICDKGKYCFTILYECDGNLILEGFDDESLAQKLSNKYIFKVVKL